MPQHNFRARKGLILMENAEGSTVAVKMTDITIIMEAIVEDDGWVTKLVGYKVEATGHADRLLLIESSQVPEEFREAMKEVER